VKAEFATPRKSVIIEQEDEVEDEDGIQRETWVTVSHAATASACAVTYRAQRRGGKGRSGHADPRRGFRQPAVRGLDPHAVLFFFVGGQVYKEKVWACRVRRPNGPAKAPDQHPGRWSRASASPHHAAAEDESSWANLDVMFATTGAMSAQQSLSDSSTSAAPASSP